MTAKRRSPSGRGRLVAGKEGGRPKKSNRGHRIARPTAQTHRVSVSRTVKASPSRAFDALSRPADLSKWFTRGARVRLVEGGAYSNRDGDQGIILKLRRPRMLRMSWENPRHCPGTTVTFTVARPAPGRARVRVTHGRLATAKDARTMKEAWSWALDSYRAYVETGTPITVEAWQQERREKTKRGARGERTRGKTAGATAKRKATRRR